MKTCLVLVTHNRIDYTRKCLQHVFEDTESDFELCIWDNASTDETPEYLKSIRESRLKQVVLSPANLGQTKAMNHLWSQSRAPLLAKLDNDCLVARGWLRIFAQAHQDIKQLGAVACWHYLQEDFDEKIAMRKIRSFGRHRIFQHPWVCGSGFVVKRHVYEKLGAWPEGSANIGTTDYFMNMARMGYINGWYYPLVLQHHMDDPLSPHCCYNDDASLLRVRDITYTLRNRNITTMEERLQRRRAVVDSLLYGSPHVRSYYGWMAQLRRRAPWLCKLLHKVGISY